MEMENFAPKNHQKFTERHGNDQNAFTEEFDRRVLFRPSCPDRLLVWYIGDESLAVSLCHVSAKTSEV